MSSLGLRTLTRPRTRGVLSGFSYLDSRTPRILLKFFCGTMEPDQGTWPRHGSPSVPSQVHAVTRDESTTSYATRAEPKHRSADERCTTVGPSLGPRTPRVLLIQRFEFGPLSSRTLEVHGIARSDTCGAADLPWSEDPEGSLRSQNVIYLT